MTSQRGTWIPSRSTSRTLKACDRSMPTRRANLDGPSFSSPLFNRDHLQATPQILATIEIKPIVYPRQRWMPANVFRRKRASDKPLLAYTPLPYLSSLPCSATIEKRNSALQVASECQLNDSRAISRQKYAKPEGYLPLETAYSTDDQNS